MLAHRDGPSSLYLSVVSDREPVVAFKDAAERYVASIDAAESKERIELLRDLASGLSAIYMTALELPNQEPGSSDPVAGLGPEDRSGALKRMESLLGTDDWYWTTAPFMNTRDLPELLTGSLADDLTDVYLDLKDGLDHLSAGVPEPAVIWEWRLSFWSHWGEHAVNALRIIHARLAVDE